MDLQGHHTIRAPRDAVIRGLNDPEMIRAILPEITTITPRAAGGFDLGLARKVGPMTVKMTGSWSAPSAPAGAIPLEIRLVGPFGAKAALVLAITVDETGPAECRFGHAGQAEFGGLVRRMVEERAAQVQSALNARIGVFARRLGAAARGA